VDTCCNGMTANNSNNNTQTQTANDKRGLAELLQDAAAVAAAASTAEPTAVRRRLNADAPVFVKVGICRI
jgi:predicted nuclease of restriction endonuclease-like RecB superfamily